MNVSDMAEELANAIRPDLVSREASERREKLLEALERFKGETSPAGLAAAEIALDALRALEQREQIDAELAAYAERLKGMMRRPSRNVILCELQKRVANVTPSHRRAQAWRDLLVAAIALTGLPWPVAKEQGLAPLVEPMIVQARVDLDILRRVVEDHVGPIEARRAKRRANLAKAKLAPTRDWTAATWEAIERQTGGVG